MPLTKIQSLGITDGTIVNADINASAAIAGTKLSGVNDAKAWVKFNGSGTVAISASFNVSSITDQATGQYEINFTTAMSDVNYSSVVSTSINFANTVIIMYTVATTTKLPIQVLIDSSGYADPDSISAAIFR